MRKIKNLLNTVIICSFAFFPFNIFTDADREDFPFYVPHEYCPDSVIDMSFLMDAPAGKHGFVRVKEGHFYFEDGRRARFWGVNLHSNRACFPAKSDADNIAKRLSQLGCNIVRMHFLDNEEPGGIISADYGDSQHFSSSQWDKLDYFIARLKERGVYVAFDVMGLGARRFGPEDGVRDYDKIKHGAAGISFFDERVIELSKKYAFEFLNHVNPYTGNSYIHEPCVAFVEMTNENTLFADWIVTRFTPYYDKKIEKLWREWRKDRDKDSRPGNWSEDREFFYSLEKDYKNKMYGYLRSIGVKVPIGCSNTPHDNLNLVSESNMDFTDIHPYWDLVYRSKRIHNRPMIKQSHFNPYTLVNHLSRARVEGKPLVCTEWGSVWPNEWRAVDMLTMASYAAFLDIDALFLYSYNGGWGTGWGDSPDVLRYDTVVMNDPAKMGLFPACSAIFLRDDVKKAKYKKYVKYPLENLFAHSEDYRDWERTAGIMYVTGLEKVFIKNSRTPGKTDYPGRESLFPEKHIAESETDEMIRDYKNGIFILNTPGCLSFSGFTGGEEFDSEELNIKAESEFATFTVISLDGKNIADSSSLLLTAVGKVYNSGQKLAPHITKPVKDLKKDVYIISRGKGPILVEDIEGRVLFKRKGGLRVFALDRYGIRKDELPVSAGSEGSYFDVSGAYKTIYYEIIEE